MPAETVPLKTGCICLSHSHKLVMRKLKATAPDHLQPLTGRAPLWRLAPNRSWPEAPRVRMTGVIGTVASAAKCLAFVKKTKKKQKAFNINFSIFAQVAYQTQTI